MLVYLKDYSKSVALKSLGGSLISYNGEGGAKPSGKCAYIAKMCSEPCSGSSELRLH